MIFFSFFCIFHQQNDIEAAREAYDAFLAHYPYCYGYWRKYADYEKRKGNKKKCEEVSAYNFWHTLLHTLHLMYLHEILYTMNIDIWVSFMDIFFFFLFLLYFEIYIF